MCTAAFNLTCDTLDDLTRTEAAFLAHLHAPNYCPFPGVGVLTVPVSSARSAAT